jgi:hypothetical protein
MSYPIHTAIEAEVAYRRERLIDHFRPGRRVGTVRQSARATRTAGPDAAVAAGANHAGSGAGADR